LNPKFQVMSAEDLIRSINLGAMNRVVQPLWLGLTLSSNSQTLNPKSYILYPKSYTLYLEP